MSTPDEFHHAAWEVFKLRELGLLQYTEQGPGAVIWPPEAGGDIAADYQNALAKIETSADSSYATFEAYLSIHNDLFGGSALTQLRRVIPIPGFHLPIPYASFADSLVAIKEALETARHAARQQTEAYRRRPIAARTLLKLQKYLNSLVPVVSALQHICVGLAEKTKGRGGPSFGSYNAAVTEYEGLRTACSQVGVELNHALAALRKAANRPTPAA